MTTKSTEGVGAGSAPSGGTSAGGAAAAKSASLKVPAAKPATVKPAAAKAAAKPRPPKKPKSRHLTPCNKCGGEIFRSSFHHFGEVILSPVLLPFRCSRCGWRQFRSSFSRVRDKSNYRRSTTDQ
ncbi:MAG TPA: hypothetical protein VHC72_16315 [Bryobacteraceae bacterium]|nr:hypothetical protein [Bryobacteraceae bacterium]